MKSSSDSLLLEMHIPMKQFFNYERFPLTYTSSYFNICLIQAQPRDSSSLAKGPSDILIDVLFWILRFLTPFLQLNWRRYSRNLPFNSKFFDVPPDAVQKYHRLRLLVPLVNLQRIGNYGRIPTHTNDNFQFDILLLLVF